MRIKKSIYVAFWAFSLLLGVGCSELRKIEKSNDWRVKYEAAINYYENEDYYRSALLFEQIQPIVRGLPEGEKIELMLSYCQYHEKAYMLASSQFRLFYETYGRSSFVEEARFMYAYSLYASTPVYTLDQQSGINAMLAMQTFVNQYPNSSFLEEATWVIQLCQEKLEKKNYKNAELYLKLRRYKAAVKAFESFKQNFPDSKYLENVAFLKVQAQFKLASQSLLHLKEDRFKSAIQFYQELVDNYPSSDHLEEAEKYYVRSRNEIMKQTNNL